MQRPDIPNFSNFANRELNRSKPSRSPDDDLVIYELARALEIMCNYAVDLEKRIDENRSGFKFKSHTLEETISHFQELAKSNPDNEQMVRWLMQTKECKSAIESAMTHLGPAHSKYF